MSKKIYKYFVSFTAMDAVGKYVGIGNREVTINEKISSMTQINEIQGVILDDIVSTNVASIVVTNFILFD